MKIKVCYKCGAQQADSRFFCVDCNTKLGSPVSKEEAELHEQKTKAMLDKLYNKSDPLYVSLLDRICGFASLAGFAVTLVFAVIYSDNIPVIGAEMLITFLLFITSGTNALIPNILWAIEKMRLSFNLRYYQINTDDLEPPPFYKVSRKIVIYGFFIIAAGLLIYLLPRLIDPSVIYDPYRDREPIDSYSFNGHEIEVYVDYIN